MLGLCTFCDNTLDDSLEHILQSAIGGRKCSRRVICGHHNHQFGVTIDDVLTTQLAPFCNLLAVTTGRGEAAPTLKNLTTKDGQRIALEPGGRFVSQPNFVDIEVAPGTRKIEITAGSEEDLAHFATQYLKKYGKDIDTLEDVSAEQRLDPGSVVINGQFGGEEALRAVAKIPLLLLASELGTDAVRGTDTMAVRKFITHGGPIWDFVRYDYETPFPRIPEHASLPEYAHRVSAITDPSTGMGIGLVELFGTFRFAVLMSESWKGAAATIHYGVDPTTGEGSETRTSTSVPLTGNEFRALGPPESALRNRIGRLFSLIDERLVSLRINAIAHESIKSVFTPDRIGTEITKEDLARLTQEAVGRFLAIHHHVPYAKKLQPAKIAEAALQERDRGRRRRRKKR